MPQIAKLIGGAGTGKTTELLRVMSKVIRTGIDPMQIGFASFTRAARREASTRAADQFDADPQTLERDGWYKTIHATCKNLLGVGKELLTTDTKEGREWLKEALQEDISSEETDQSEAFTDTQTDASRALRLWETARNRLEPLLSVHTTAAECDDRTPPYEECLRIVERYEQYKRLDGRCDFTDLLSRFAGWRLTPHGAERCNPEGEPPELKAWIFDECQDTTALADAVQRRLVTVDECQYVYLAADPFQSIYGWAGADAKHFMSWPADKQRVMPRSYRCSADILTVGENILRACSDYWDRKIQPAGHEGVVEEAIWGNGVFDDVEPTHSWLILARTNRGVSAWLPRLFSAGIPFVPTKGNVSNRWRAPVRNGAIKAMLSLEAGAPIDGLEWTYILKQFTNSVEGVPLFVHGTKARFDNEIADPQGEFPWVPVDELGKLGGTPEFAECLRSGQWRTWIDDVDVYEAAMARWGLEAVDQSKVRVGTIHSVKGAEADNVILLTSLSGPCYRAATESEEGFNAECRVFYVGATRARKRLIILRDPRAKYRKRIEV